MLFVGPTWFREGITELFDLLKQNLMFSPYLIRHILLFQHEESSVQMFEYLLEKNGLTEEVKNSFSKLKDTAIEFIKELIKGEGETMKERKYLYQVNVCDIVYEVLYLFCFCI